MASLNEKYLPLLARILLGAIFLVFGLNGLLHFMPMPEMPTPAGELMGALAATGYMMPLIKGVEIIVGVMLLVNRFVPLALALIAPGVVNIFLFHAFLAPTGLPLAVALLVAEIYLAWSYRDLYRPMLTPHVLPTSRKAPDLRFTFDRTAEAGYRSS